jgi:hypothetical protein
MRNARYTSFFHFGGLIVTIVPFPNFFREDMVRELGEVTEEEMESLVSPLARGDKDCAQVLGVDDD